MLTIPQRLALAVEHHEAARRSEAEALYRGVLAEAPQHAHALHLLGVLAHQAGRREEAIGLIWRALAAHGPHPVFHSNLAAVYLADDRLLEAEAHCREALRLKPDLADAHTNLGTVLQRQGQLQEAARAFGEAVELNRLRADRAGANPGPYGARPVMAQGQGQLPAVLAHLREAVRLAPTNEQAQHDLGLVLIAAGQPAQAVAPLREAIRLKPNFSQAHSNLGTALHHLDQVEEAMQCYREALRVDPENARARNNLGSLLEYRGQIGDALGEFQETLRRDPNNAQAIFVLSELAAAGHYRFPDPELRRIGELAQRADLRIDDRCHLDFALALVLDKNGACDQAFVHALRANALRKEIDGKCGMVFDPAAHRQYVDRLIATFTPAYFERVRSYGAPSELPIFVVGLMRSGTTLAEHILASHPQVHGAGELRDVGVMVGGLARRTGSLVEYPECMASLDATLSGTLAQEYLQTLGRLGGGASRVVDKMPINFLGLGIIATLFPRARIVHCSRDPVDTCLSCFFRNFAGPFPFTFDLGHMGAYYREYQRLMAHWVRVLPMPIFELRYEELTADQEAVSRRLLAYCGLEWDERCLRFNETRRVVRTASSLQVRQPMYRSAVGRWRRYEAHLRPLLEGLAGRGTDCLEGL